MLKLIYSTNVIIFYIKLKYVNKKRVAGTKPKYQLATLKNDSNYILQTIIYVKNVHHLVYDINLQQRLKRDYCYL